MLQLSVSSDCFILKIDMRLVNLKYQIAAVNFANVFTRCKIYLYVYNHWLWLYEGPALSAKKWKPLLVMLTLVQHLFIWIYNSAESEVKNGPLSGPEFDDIGRIIA